jgi:ABC-type sulfate transport system substrate-binding protein|uniref:Uncharacterized protein n=12 Tax=Serratia TaxID=613 RepID=V5YV42_SERMA|nr:hypothetical protein [Serratia marcescens]
MKFYIDFFGFSPILKSFKGCFMPSCVMTNGTYLRKEGLMKKSIIALSALLLASPVFAAETATDTAAHASNEVVAEAHKGADTAKEKLHQSQDKGEELKLKAKHAAEGKSDSVGSKVSEGSQKAWHSTKQGTEKAWDKTKQGAESLKNKATE